MVILQIFLLNILHIDFCACNTNENQVIILCPHSSKAVVQTFSKICCTVACTFNCTEKSYHNRSDIIIEASTTELNRIYKKLKKHIICNNFCHLPTASSPASISPENSFWMAFSKECPVIRSYSWSISLICGKLLVARIMLKVASSVPIFFSPVLKTKWTHI